MKILFRRKNFALLAIAVFALLASPIYAQATYVNSNTGLIAALGNSAVSAIDLDATSTDGNYTIPQTSISRALTIKGINGKPVIYQTGGGKHFVMTNSLTLTNIMLLGPNVTYSGGNITVKPEPWVLGGGVSSNQAITITDCTIAGCSASTAGGAITMSATTSATSITNTQLQYNTSAGNGGAMSIANPLTISNCTFSDNKSWYNIATSAYAVGSSGTTGGGGVFASNSLALSGNILFNNNKTGNNGGGIYKGATGAFTTTGLTSLKMSGNEASLSATSTNFIVGGGAISSFAALDLTGNASKDNITFTNNKSLGSGGALLFSRGTYNLTNIVFQNNTASYYGGAVQSVTELSGVNLFLNLENVSATQNTSAYGGGVSCYINGSNSIALTANNCNFDYNTTTGAYASSGRGGAGLHSNSANVTMTVSNSSFTGNSSAVNGGGIYSFGVLSLENITFFNNKAGWTGSLWTGNANSGFGGGFYAGEALTLKGSIVLEKDSSANGGGGMYKALFGALTMTNLTSFRVVDNVTSMNSATSSGGGGIYSAVDVTLSDQHGLIMTGNQGYSGGGIYTNNVAALNLTNLTIELNTATAVSVASQGGGAIYSNNGVVYITNCTLKNNKSASSAGALYTNRAALLQNVILTNNESTVHGGAIATGTDANSFLTLQDCTISNNIAGATGLGGGVYIATTTGPGLSLKGSIIMENNSAGSHGGAIAYPNTNNKFDITGLTLIKLNGNKSDGNGGGIYTTSSLIFPDQISITFTNNTAKTSGGGIYATAPLTLTSATLKWNKAGYDQTQTWQASGDGGAIYSSNNLDLRGDLVLENDTATNNGGAIYKFSGATPFTTDNLNSISVSYNNARNGSGGGIYIASNTANLSTLSGAFSVKNNTARLTGGGIFIGNASTLTLGKAEISNNKSGYSIATDVWGTTGQGGGIYAYGSLYIAGSLTVDNNMAGGDGGGIYKSTNAGSILATIGTIPKIIISNNTARNVSGGGIFTNVDLDLSAADTLIVLNNTSKNNGGGIENLAILTLRNAYFSENRAGYDVSTGQWTTGSGGGIFTAGDMTFKGNMRFENNTAGTDGGGTYKTNNTLNPIDFSNVTSLTVTGNIARSGGGGGMYLSETTDLTSPSTVYYYNNKAKINGGGIYINGTLTLGNATFSYNKAGYDVTNNSWLATGNGGAMNVFRSLILTKNLICENDSAGGNGGAIYKSAGSTFVTTDLTGLTLRKNSAVLGSGGAIYTGTALTLNASNGVILTDNYAGVSGGGISATSNLTLTDLAIKNNTALGLGGGINTTNVLISTNNTFESNMAANGGAIAGSTNADLTILNNTFYQNSSSSEGSGVYYSGVNPVKITLSTFNGNTKDAIYFTTSTNKKLYGNLIYGNGTGPEINLNPIVAEYNVVRGMLLPGAGNIQVDAGRAKEIFTKVLSGDLAELKNNGGITNSINIIKNGFANNVVPKTMTWLSGITTDQNYLQRAMGCSVDAGSVEIQAIDPAYSRWKSSGNQNDWNDPANWDNWDGAGQLITEPTIPGNCTNVLIPDQQAFYPVLQKAGTTLPNNQAYLQAVCDSIKFEFGGEVAKTSFLNYTSAAVQLKLKSNAWQMISPSLQSMYTGDYFVDRATPAATASEIRNSVLSIVEPAGAIQRLAPGAVSMKLFQTDNPQKGSGKAATKFSGTFKNVDTPVTTGMGYAVWVDDDVNAQNTISFPKSYNYYNYYDVYGSKTRENEISMSRTGYDRFIYEPNVVGGSDSFTQAIDNSTHSGQVIIGNPYMSHLDIVKLQEANNQYLKPQFAIWNEPGNYNYMIAGSNGIISTAISQSTTALLAPMEPVLMTVQDAYATSVNSIPVAFNADMSVTSPGNTFMRSASHTVSDVLKLEILKDNIRQNGLALHYQEGASRSYNGQKDVWTIFPNSVTSFISLYMLVDGNAASIHTTGNIDSPIDLGISVGSTIKNNITAGKKEYYTIKIADDNMLLDGREIYLYDALKKQKYNLSQSPYSFENTTGDISGRFQLFTGQKIITGTDFVSSEGTLLIHRQNNNIKVESSSGDPIKSVKVYNVIGKLLFQKNNINNSDFSFILPESDQVVIIKAQTQAIEKTEKIAKMSSVF